MKNYEEMTRDKLIKTLKDLSSQENIKQSDYEHTQYITEQNQAEEALRKSEELYRSLFDNMLNGFAYCRMFFEQDCPQDFVYISVNTAFECLTGLKNITGKKISEIIPGIRESDPELFEIYGRVALTGKPERFERYVKALKKWFSVSVYSPKRGYFIAVFEVITERKQIDEALLESEERFRAIFEHANDGILVANIASKKFVMANAVMGKMLGYSTEELLELEIDHIHPPDRIEEVLNAFERMAMGEIVFSDNIPFIRKDRSVFYADINTSLVMIGKQLCLMGIFRDITERKLAAESLRKSEAALNKAQSVAHVGSWTWYIQENRMEWSDEMYRIFGIDKENFSGDISEVYTRTTHPDDLAGVERVKLLVIQEKKPLPLEYRIVWPDGTERILWFEPGELNLDDSDNPAVLTGILQDITERKHVEYEIKRSNLELMAANEQLVKIRNELEVSEKLFHGLFDNMTSGSAIYYVINDGSKGSDYIIRSINRAGLQMEGKAFDDVVGRSLFDLRPKIDEYGLITVLKRVWETGEPSFFPVKIYHDERFCRYYENHVFKLSTGEVVTIYDDVTERRQIEEARLESEERYRVIFETSRDAIMILEPPLWNFTTGNPATIEMFNAKNEKAFRSCDPGKLSPMRQPDGHFSDEKAREMIEIAMCEGYNFFEWTHKRLDGEEFPATVLLTRVEYSGKQFPSVLI